MKTGFKNLIAYKKSYDLALEIYSLTSNYPKSEILGITSQMRRAATSIPANLAEGYSRLTDREKLRFVNISLASLAELEYFLDFSENLNYIDNKNFNRISSLVVEVGNLLGGFSRKLKLTALTANSK